MRQPEKNLPCLLLLLNTLLGNSCFHLLRYVTLRRTCSVWTRGVLLREWICSVKVDLFSVSVSDTCLTFQKSYWCGTAQLDKDDVINSDVTPDAVQTEFFERDPEGIRAGIRIQNLRKVSYVLRVKQRQRFQSSRFI